MAKSALQQLAETVQAAAISTKEAVMNSNFMDGQKGLATLAGYARGGLKDLHAAVVHAFPESRQQHEALGMAASPTPQMVHEGLTGKASDGRNIDMDMGR
jgi:hypothetical protein